jgi:membrane-bound hydrogenase subunit alpha
VRFIDSASLAGKDRSMSAVRYPLGPYTNALAQPLPITLILRGDRIEDVELGDMALRSRSVVALAEGKPVDEALTVLEHSCANAGQTHRLALALALEAATNTPTAKHARLTRVLFAEVERILARLWMLGLSARAAGYPMLWRTALDQREDLFAAAQAVTGERVHWGVATVGGAREDITLTNLASALTAFAPACEEWRRVTIARGPLGEAAAGMGVVSEKQAQDLSGLAGRAAGSRQDIRESAPYDGYVDLAHAWPSSTYKTGDAAARLLCAAEDLTTSVAVAQACLAELEKGADDAPKEGSARSDAQGVGLAMVEGPHGAVTIRAARDQQGAVERLECVTPGAALYGLLPQILHGHNAMQAPLILASLDLCAECLAL